MHKIKALYFDVGGTVFDWKNTAREHIQELADAQGKSINSEAFANDWREEMMNVHTQVRYGNLPWINTDEMNVQALDNLTARYPLLSTIDKMSLTKATWHHLRTFSGAPEMIKRLRKKYTVTVLTILSMESIVNSSKEANVQWDAILSCELLGYYKPSLQAYQKATYLLGFKPNESMMIAAHKGDLSAAQTAGMHTAYVSVPEKDNVGEGFGKVDESIKFDIDANNFEELCTKLDV